MNFDKKYWSDGDFTRATGEKYYGYVGTLDGEAYIFDTEEPLTPNDTFITKVNLSDNFFDRTLAHTLELPYKKEDVAFAANDFLYAGTVKTIIERLQENNEYIFRNAIIPNSILPYNTSISMFATEDITTFYFFYKPIPVEEEPEVIDGEEVPEEPEVVITPIQAPADAYFKNGNIYQLNEAEEEVLLGTCAYILNESYSGSFRDEVLFMGDEDVTYTAEQVNSLFYVNQSRNYSRVPRVTSDNKIESGILKRYSFSDKGLSAKTQVDPYFYPQREYHEYRAVKSVTGTWEDRLSSKTLLVKNEDRDAFDKLTVTAAADPEEVYNAINNIQTSIDESWDDIITDLREAAAGINEKLALSERFYDDLSGTFTIGDVYPTIDYHNTIMHRDLSDIFDSFYKTYTTPEAQAEVDTNFNIYIKRLSFLVKTEDGAVPVLNGIGEGYRTTYVDAGDGFQHIVYHFEEGQGPALTRGTENPDGTGLWKWDFTLNFATAFKAALKQPQPTVAITPLKYTVTLSYGTQIENPSGTIIEPGATIASYKRVPLMRRTRKYTWIWTDGDSGKLYTASPESTYKHLIESVDWIKAAAPKLVYYGENGIDPLPTNLHKLMAFTPSEDMTAEDCHIYTTNNILSYRSFPAIDRKTIYEYILEDGRSVSALTGDEPLMYVENSLYKQGKYNMQTYTFVTAEDGTETIEQTYKSADDAYRELNDGIYDEDELIEPGVYHKSHYDYIPEFKTVTTSESKSEPVHDFTQLTNAEMHIVKRSEDGTYVDVLLFLMFKTKVLITRVKHYINEGDNFINDFRLNLREPAGEHYLEINCVDPFNKNSLLFKNLTDIKLHKNMLYVADGDLNMVMRYDVEYLISPEEENSFDIRSIKLLDVLQGDGELADKIYFKNPFAIAASDDRVYIVDRGNKCVKVYTPSLNYVKILKNGYYATHDIQAVAVNPYPVTLENGVELNKDTLWVFSTYADNLYLSILDNDSVVSYGKIEDIKLLSDRYSWVEEFKNIEFSHTNSNIYYLATTKRVYKFQSSRPYYPLGSLSYFKQRSLINSMVWGRMRYKWTKLPRIYSTFQDGNAIDNQVTWNYVPPRSSAEVLDNRCFTLCGLDGYDDQFNGDLIFHLGTLYDDNKITQYIKTHNHLFDGEMTFNDIPVAELVSMIKSFNMLFYIEPDSYISSLNSNYINVYKTEIDDVSFDDYINALTFNKLLYSVVYNLLTIKNQLIGTFKAATNLDNVIVYDNMLFDDYFAKLEMGNEANYFVHDNEVVSIVVNRVFEIIYDIQQKIIDNMQTKFMATQSYVNNSSRII